MATQKDNMRATAIAAALRFGDRRILSLTNVEKWFEQYYSSLKKSRKTKVPPPQREVFANRPRVIRSKN